jgi:exopolysaccharide biosynthesis polyprenyl glycosylphosphotransferase
MVLIFLCVGLSIDPYTAMAAHRAHVVSGLCAAAVMLMAMASARAYDVRILGAGSAEFTRLSRATVGSALVLSFVALTFEVRSVRPWVLLYVPLVGLACGLGRYALRKALHRHRRAGRFLLPVLAVGSATDVADLVARTLRDPHFGWVVTGACTTSGTGLGGAALIAGVPVVGDLDVVGRLACNGDYRVVAVAASPGWGPKRLQQLSWDLEKSPVELAVHPGLMEIAGPRLHIAPVDGMPLLRLTEPRFTGFARLLKDVVDRLAAAILIVVFAPILFALAAAVRLEGGPALYRQERVGAGGKSFRMTKFRSMVVGADTMRAELLGQNTGDGPLFKMHQDPRFTRIGKLLRRYSLDELPQLFNVLVGSMSFVGPRPPLPEEVAHYSEAARRRLLVRPGMTGLWQVSGRSDLSWEESVRLDLRYVENWSLALDAVILWKTAGAVAHGRGAY